MIAEGGKAGAAQLLDEMAGVGFQDEPDGAAGGELQGAHSAGRDVDDETRACIHVRDNKSATRFERFERTGQNVSRAEEVRWLSGKQDVACADGELELCAGAMRAEWDFQLTI